MVQGRCSERIVIIANLLDLFGCEHDLRPKREVNESGFFWLWMQR